jgi:hypothetical protein
MEYPLYNLNDKEFAELANMICSHIFGLGIINFSEGKDGGQDGKFTGTANNYPSKSSPWKGKFVIQSKHTSKVNASCSDSDFHTILKKEFPKISELVKKDELDNYMVFTNRKLTALQDLKIKDEILSYLSEKKLPTINCQVF